MNKLMKFKKEARQALSDGADLMYDAVATTFGPKGRNVAIGRPWGVPINVHDGVTVAREVGHEDPFIQMGIDMIREAAQNTNTEGGDGTTTATILAHDIIHQGMELLDKGTNPMVLRNELNAALKIAVAEIKNLAIPTDKQDDLQKVAFISSADMGIGKIVAEAVSKMGKDGLVTVDESPGTDISAEYTNGLEISKGWASPWFVTNPDTLEAVVEDNPVILIFEKPITTGDEMIPILQLLVQQQEKNIVIIGSIDGTALATLIKNKRESVINVVVIPPPGYNETKQSYLEDIAIATGARVIVNPHEFNTGFVGHAKSVTAGKDNSVIVEGKGKKENIEARVATLKKQLEAATYLHDKERLMERIAKLTQGVTVIHVGAKSDLERREKLERVKDAVGAAQAVLVEGVVTGGAVTYLHLAKALSGKSDGEKLLSAVLLEPIKKLLVNAGESKDKISEILGTIEKGSKNIGYNVNNSKVEDLVEAGVIDPAKVVRLSLENAVAVAGTILTNDCLIVDKPVEEKNTMQ